MAAHPAAAVHGGRRRVTPLAPVRRLGVVLHPEHAADALLDEVDRWARAEGVVLCGLRRQAAALPAGVALHDVAELGAASDVVLAMGGD